VKAPSKWTRAPRPIGALIAVLAAAGPALADWQRLDAAALEATLADAEVSYDGIAWQHFLPSGRMVTRSAEAPSGAASWGEWRIDRDSYCARMPPATEWECYWVEIDGAGGIRFIDGYGNVSTGAFVTGEGQAGDE
jgi:hypothetical protein